MNNFSDTYTITSCYDCLFIKFIFIFTKNFFSSSIEWIQTFF